MSVPIPLALDRAASTRPDHAALTWRGDTWTYADLSRWAELCAARIRAVARPGDRVAVAAEQGPEVVALFHAVQRIGAIFVPLNVHLTDAELAAQLEVVEPALVVTSDVPHLERALGSSLARRADSGRDQPLADSVRGQRPDTAIVEVKEFGASGAGSAGTKTSAPTSAKVSAEAAAESPDLDSPLAIVFTSGTYGRPRGVTLSHANLAWSAAASALRLGHDPADVWLDVLPLFHMGGLSILLRCAWGATTVRLEEGFDAAVVAQALETDVTLVSLVPTMLRRLLDAPLAPSPALRAVLVGGGPLTASLVERARAAGLPVCPSYGATEAGSQIATQVAWDPSPGLSAPPMPFTSVRVVHAGADAPPDVEGEILVSGPTVMRGYFRRPDANESVLVDGWLHTGDLGSLDDQGRLTVTGRRRDRIVTGGENVSPAEVESVLEADPRVAEACVVGVPSEEWGMAVAAALVPAPGAEADTDAVLDAARGRLSAFKLPKVVIWIDALPRTGSGKVRRDEVASHFTSLDVT